MRFARARQLWVNLSNGEEPGGHGASATPCSSRPGPEGGVGGREPPRRAQWRGVGAVTVSRWWTLARKPGEPRPDPPARDRRTSRRQAAGHGAAGGDASGQDRREAHCAGHALPRLRPARIAPRPDESGQLIGKAHRDATLAPTDRKPQSPAACDLTSMSSSRVDGRAVVADFGYPSAGGRLHWWRFAG